ncbi:MAG: TetR/AcrR family transcriptional regulator [Microthrixaceae bacterium]
MGSDDQTRSAKWLRRREQIVDVSAAVFAERGFHATSTTELCEANGLGKGALYYYIGSKSDLLVAINDRVMDEVLVGAEAALERGSTASEHLMALGRELLDIITRYPNHVWVFLHEFPNMTGEDAVRLHAKRHAFEGIVESTIERGVASGEFRDVNPKIASRAWLGIHDYTYLWLRPEGELSAADVAEQFGDMFLSGMLP